MKIVNGFGSFSIKDTDRSLKFYKETLGLDANKEEKMGLIKLSLPNGGEIMIYPKGDGHTPATFTVLNLVVDNLDESVDELSSKGIVFEQYDNENMKTDEKGIVRSDGEHGPSIAWFKDLDGNILSLIEKDK